MEKQELKPQKLEVRYLKDDERIRSRELYEEVFVEDADGFSELYYKIKARDNRILVAENDGAIVSMCTGIPIPSGSAARPFRRIIS